MTSAEKTKPKVRRIIRSRPKDIECFLTSGARSRLFLKRNGAMRLSERSSFLVENSKAAASSGGASDPLPTSLSAPDAALDDLNSALGGCVDGAPAHMAVSGGTQVQSSSEHELPRAPAHAESTVAPVVLSLSQRSTQLMRMPAQLKDKSMQSGATTASVSWRAGTAFDSPSSAGDVMRAAVREGRTLTSGSGSEANSRPVSEVAAARTGIVTGLHIDIPADSPEEAAIPAPKEGYVIKKRETGVQPTALKHPKPAVSVPEQSKADARRACAVLLDKVLQDMHLAEHLPCKGGRGQPAASPEEAEESRLVLLQSMGGVQSSKTNELRTFLIKYAVFVQDDVDPFKHPGCIPVAVATMIQFRDYARGMGMLTVADSVESAYKSLVILGVPVVGSVASLAERRKRRQPGSENAPEDNSRHPVPPNYVLKLELEVWQEGKGMMHNLTPRRMCVNNVWLQLKCGARGCAIVDGVFKIPADTDPEWTLVQDTKSGRADSQLHALFGGYFCADPMPGEREYITFLAKKGFNMAQWAKAKKPGSFADKLGHTAIHSQGFLLAGDGSWQHDPQRKRAIEQLTKVIEFISGETKVKLQALKLTGTHTWRNVAPEVASCGQHGTMSLDVAGDWEPSDDTLNRHPKIKSRKARAATRNTYRQTWLRAEQVLARKRVFGLIRVALVERCKTVMPKYAPCIEAGGLMPIANTLDSWLPATLKWGDLIPRSPAQDSPLREWMGETKFEIV